MVIENIAPPEGMLPKINESASDIVESQIKSSKVIFRLEYERQIMTKLTTVTKAEPPLAKIENSGMVKAVILRCSPRLSLLC